MFKLTSPGTLIIHKDNDQLNQSDNICPSALRPIKCMKKDLNLVQRLRCFIDQESINVFTAINID